MRTFRLGLFALTLTFLTLGTARAQTMIGGEIGDPSGLVVRPGSAPNLEFLAAWDLDKFFFLNIHRMQDSAFEAGRPLKFMYGPGLFIGLRERSENEVVAGISGRLGLAYVTSGYRVYLAVTPRLSVIPDTHGDIGGALGVMFRL